jgi:hypothetical protein
MKATLGGILGKIPRPTPAMAVALLALLIAASGAAVAAIPSEDGTITACRHNKSGALRVINAEDGQTCNSKETQLAWKDSTQLPHGFYNVSQGFNQASSANGPAVGQVLCDEGDQVVGGGYSALDETSTVVADSPDFDTGQSQTQSGWVIVWTTPPSTPDSILVNALCADFGAPHPVPEA